MFEIRLESVGKQFNNRWLFRDIDWSSNSGKKLALIGANGSGKSTLLRIIGGQMMPSAGRVAYIHQGKSVAPGSMYAYLSWSAPYLELYPDLTLYEQVRLHFRFKPCLWPETEEAIAQMRLEAHTKKALRHFSSGMLQRLKAGLALFSQTPVVLLDEPTSNLDDENAKLVMHWIETYAADRYVFLASNLEREYNPFPNRILLRG